MIPEEYLFNEPLICTSCSQARYYELDSQTFVCILPVESRTMSLICSDLHDPNGAIESTLPFQTKTGKRRSKMYTLMYNLSGCFEFELWLCICVMLFLCYICNFAAKPD